MKKIIKNAEILCVGTEILIGDIVNTNAAYISKRLADLGINQYYQAVVGDNPARLKDCIENALKRCDLLILSGGLGPTYDDLTKETAAECMGRKLILHKASLERIKKYFAERGRTMAPVNEKQAFIPEGSYILENDYGTAPGCVIEDDENCKYIAMLPGPPRELKPMFDNKLVPYLKEHTDKVFVSRNVNIIGIGESDVEQKIGAIMKTAQNPTIAPYCLEGEVRLRVTSCSSDEDSAQKLCRDGIDMLYQTEIGKYIYGIDTTLEKACVDYLKKAGKTVSAAESCTGGLILKLLTDVPGSSSAVTGGVVCYDERIKTELCYVDRKLIDDNGVVSFEVAEALAKGIKMRMKTDVGIGVTGFAGPSGGNEKYPTGTVFYSVIVGEKQITNKLFIPREREYVRKLTANAVFSEIINLIKQEFK